MPMGPAETRRSRLGSHGVRPRQHRVPRWVVRLALLVAVALGALVYGFDLDAARMLGFLGASGAFVLVCAALALLVVSIGKALRGQSRSSK
jgi:hypothetical protein